MMRIADALGGRALDSELRHIVIQLDGTDATLELITVDHAIAGIFFTLLKIVDVVSSLDHPYQVMRSAGENTDCTDYYLRCTVALPAPIAGNVVFRPESLVDRMGKAVHLRREFQTGDAHFDRQVFINSDLDDASLGALLHDDKIRTHVAALARGDAGCRLVVGKTSTLIADIPLHNFVADKFAAGDELIGHAVRATRGVSTQFDTSGYRPLFAGVVPSTKASSRVPELGRLTGIGVIVGAMALFCAIYSGASGSLFDLDSSHHARNVGAAVGLALCLGVIGLAILRFGGCSNSMHSMLPLAIAASTLVLDGAMCGRLANQRFDGQACVHHVARISRSVDGYYNTQLHVDVESAGSMVIADPTATMPADGSYDVCVGPGALGTPWITNWPPVSRSTK